MIAWFGVGLGVFDLVVWAVVFVVARRAWRDTVRPMLRAFLPQ